MYCLLLIQKEYLLPNTTGPEGAQTYGKSGQNPNTDERPVKAIAEANLKVNCEELQLIGPRVQQLVGTGLRYEGNTELIVQKCVFCYINTVIDVYIASNGDKQAIDSASCPDH